MTALVLPLVSAGSAALAGGKAASLGELARAGLPVPPGFVVTAEAHRRAMSSPLLPADLVAEITDGYRALGGGPVAVRSSATMEDSAEASFAGLHDSYLGVRDVPGVLDAIRGCWASLDNDESVSYRRRLGLRDVAMAVVVQRMVRPRAAGVMFTCSPVTGDRSVVAIEATWGLGSALVAGDVSPDGFTVSKVTGEITGRRVGAKLRFHSFSPNVPGISESATPPELRGSPCLTDDQARELARIASRVEDHYGSAQDIEWALLDDGGIVLLQSRPETVWAGRARPPVATPKLRPGDHVVAMFGKPPWT
jgi:pyruvate,water dikinase